MPVENRHPLTQELIDWADVIIVMETHHAGYILSNFQTDRTKIKVLDIADVYYRDDPELIRQLEMKVIPVLQSFEWTHFHWTNLIISGQKRTVISVGYFAEFHQ